MGMAENLLKSYLEVSEDLLELDFDEDIDEFEECIKERSELLSQIIEAKINFKDIEFKLIGEKIMELDGLIQKRISDEKSDMDKAIHDLKQEKTEQGRKRNMLKTYTNKENSQNSFYFDQKK